MLGAPMRARSKTSAHARLQRSCSRLPARKPKLLLYPPAARCRRIVALVRAPCTSGPAMMALLLISFFSPPAIAYAQRATQPLSDRKNALIVSSPWVPHGWRLFAASEKPPPAQQNPCASRHSCLTRYHRARPQSDGLALQVRERLPGHRHPPRRARRPAGRAGGGGPRGSAGGPTRNPWTAATPTKIRAPTADGRAPSSPDDIDPALLKELYKVGPALKKQEVAKPTAPATGEDARRRQRFNELRRDEEAPAGRIAEADVANFLDWRAAGMASEARRRGPRARARLRRWDGGGAAADLRRAADSTSWRPEGRALGARRRPRPRRRGGVLGFDDDEPLPGRRRRNECLSTRGGEEGISST